MKHISNLKETSLGVSEAFVVRATGRYYTHRTVADHLVKAAIQAARRQVSGESVVRIVDPFGGDGRLIRWFIERWHDAKLPQVQWEVELWDMNSEGLERARESFGEIEGLGVRASFSYLTVDSFSHAVDIPPKFDVVLTNPPWELLKPDSRELKHLRGDLRTTYVEQMREYDRLLATNFPESQPERKFAGWGTNLSRVGLELCFRICKRGGVIAIVMPASFLADEQSFRLRRRVLTESRLRDVAYFPAEAKLFGKADVATSTLVFEIDAPGKVLPTLTQYDKYCRKSAPSNLNLTDEFLERNGYVVPLTVDTGALAVLQRLPNSFPTLASLERDGCTGLWGGREIDETGIGRWLSTDGEGPLFVKGRMIERFGLCTRSLLRVSRPDYQIPRSVGYERIAWRDVSRPNQKRRVIAALIPAGTIAGNSLGVAYFRDCDSRALRSLLGVMSSLVFEFQLRSYLATGHVSLSALRKVRVPGREALGKAEVLWRVVCAVLDGEKESEAYLEAVVAKLMYNLSLDDFSLVLNTFPRMTTREKVAILTAYEQIPAPALGSDGAGEEPVEETACGLHKTICIPPNRQGIANHLSAKLSELDMQMVRAVPPGGNWKNIPVTLPSRRLEQIRVGFENGTGSRSTYYGRLRRNMPAYTISTYFNRPGNGCHIHYDQDRVLSQREAARLQSFPDHFAFLGSQGDVNTQIGNAVPPLLAYQIAVGLGRPGYFADLFCGAGGMGLGFTWSGWKPVVANDINERFLETYARNVHDRVVFGSITDDATFERLVQIVMETKAQIGDSPLWVLGGPPCQGFSTAGNRRSMEDERNLLYWHYVRFLERVRPDGFVFENVTGLLNMDAGRVFEQVRDGFRSVMPSVHGWVLSAEEYAVPQRRKRVILVGRSQEPTTMAPPRPVTSCNQEEDLFDKLPPAISVDEALSDLPALTPGQDGSCLDYISEPRTVYQSLMRGCLTPQEYLDRICSGQRAFDECERTL